MNIRYFNKLIELLPEPVRQFGGLVSLMFVVIFSFAILNVFFGQGDELVEKMKKFWTNLKLMQDNQKNF